MIIVRHRINTIKGLKTVPTQYGVEIDVRANGKQLILHHAPHEAGDPLEEFLKNYRHRFIMFNIKTAGIEDEVHTLAKQYTISDYFLFDVGTPYLWKAAAKGERRVAVRYSEDECIHTALAFKGKIDWVWIDTKTRLPLDHDVIEQLRGFKTALVCPERWGRPQDSNPYIAQMKALNFKLDMVMTAAPYVALYEASGL